MNIIKIITETVDWFENLFHKKYGIRTLYLTVLLIPSICLGLFYYLETSENNRLVLKIEEARLKEIDCLNEKANIKSEVRKEILKEFKETYETIKSFELEVLLENQKTVEKIKKLESKIN